MSQRALSPAQKKLEPLRQQVLRMGHLAEAILEKAMQSIWERNDELGLEVGRDERPNDRHDIDNDGAVQEYRAIQAPGAQDLREVIAIKTATTDLERVGDIARNIAKCAIRLIELPSTAPPEPLQLLANSSRRALMNALLSFADYDASLARAVLAADDEIDADEERAFRASIRDICDHPEMGEQEVFYILIAKNLERVGDHATNIAEDVILVVESLNLKHAEKLVS